MLGERYCQQCAAVLPGGVSDTLCSRCFHESLQAVVEIEPDPDLPPTERMTMQFAIEPFDPLMPTKDQRFGDYELLEQIAQGGMGLVFKARQISLNRIVALKVIRAGQLASAADVQRFRIEAEAAAHLDHPRIVPIYEIGELKGIHYFSMKLVEGGNLAQHMQRCARDHQAAARLLAAAARGIEYAHQRGVLHRDLKPANILVDLDDRPHVTDFGVAKRVGGQCLGGAEMRLAASISGTLSGGIVGTPSYMAPEQAAGTRDGLTVAVDIYSLGAILYEILTGRPPFKAATQMATLRLVLEESPPRPRALNPKVDRALEAICLKCLKREPANRYHSAEDLVNDLERWLKNEPIEVQRGNAWVRAVKWARRRPTTAALAMTTLCISALGLGAALWQHEQVQAQEQRLQLTRQAEENERLKADSALEQLRMEQYADCIGVAQRCWQASTPAAAEQALNACPADLRGWEWRLLQRLCQDGVRKLKSPLPQVTCLAFSANHQLILANETGAVATVERLTGRPLQEWQSGQGAIHALAVSPDGARLATAGADRTLVVWEAQTGQRLTTFCGYPEGVSAVAFKPVALLAGPVNPGPSAPDSQGRQTVAHLAIAAQELASDGALQAVVKIWDLSRLIEPVEIPVGEAAVSALALSPDGRQLAFVGKDLTLQVWNLGSLADTTVNIRLPTLPQRVWFTADGVAVQAAFGQEVISWNSRTGTETGRFDKGRTGSAVVACCGDGQWVAAADSTGDLTLWNTARREDEVVLEDSAGPITQLALSSDGQRLAVLDGRSVLRVWHAGNFQPLYQIKGGQEAPLTAAAFSTDSRRLHSADRKGMLRCFDAATGEESAWFVTSLKEVTCLAVLADGHALAVSGPTGKVEIWNAESQSKLLDFSAHAAPVNRIASSPDGWKLATASDDHTVRLWDAASGVELLALQGHAAPVLDAVFSRDGELLVSASADQTVRVWDLRDGTELHVLRAHLGPVTGLALHPDGRRLVTTSVDRTVRVWDLAFGAELLVLKVGEPVRSAAFTGDGQRLLGGGRDGTVRLWAAGK